MKRFRVRWALVLTLVWLVLAAGIGLGLFAWVEREGLDPVRTALSHAAPWLLAWRIALFLGLMVYWPELMGWMARRLELSERSETELRQWRWRAGAGLLVMDLVLVEGALTALQNTVR